MKFLIPDMSCEHCVATIEKAIRAADQSSTVDADVLSHTVEINSDRPATEISNILGDAGYPASLAVSVI